MHTKTIVVEYHNGGICAYKFNSDVEFNIDDIHKWLIKNDGFNEYKDSFSIIDDVTEVNLKKKK